MADCCHRELSLFERLADSFPLPVLRYCGVICGSAVELRCRAAQGSVARRPVSRLGLSHHIPFFPGVLLLVTSVPDWLSFMAGICRVRRTGDPRLNALLYIFCHTAPCSTSLSPLANHGFDVALDRAQYDDHSPTSRKFNIPFHCVSTCTHGEVLFPTYFTLWLQCCSGPSIPYC